MVPAHRFHVPCSVLRQTLPILNCYNNSIKKLPFLFSSLWRNQGSERLSNLCNVTQLMCGKNEYVKIMWIFYVINSFVKAAVLCLVTQWCPTLCDPMDCCLPGAFVHGDSPGKNTGVGSHAFLQGIFPTQGFNPGLSHCRWILYHLSHQGSPKYWASLSLHQWNFLSQELNWILLHCRWILTNWATREAAYSMTVPYSMTVYVKCFGGKKK